MPSSWSASLRLELEFTGENVNLWGDKTNVVFQHIDYSIAGWLTKALTGDYALTTANAGDDEARAAMLKFTGAGPFTVTIPSVSKAYHVWNACTAALTITTGAGATVTLDAGERCTVGCDGSGVYRFQPTNFGGGKIGNLADPTNAQDAATKNYVDQAAFSAAGGNLPGQAGNAGKYLKTNGTVPSWSTIQTSDVTGFATGTSGVRTGTSTSAAITPGDMFNALAEVPLTDAATIAVDLSTGFDFAVTLGGNRTLGNPTNPKVGQSGVIRVIQDGTGNRTLAYASNWKRQGGAAVLSTTAGTEDEIVYRVVTATRILYDLKKNPT